MSDRLAPGPVRAWLEGLGPTPRFQAGRDMLPPTRPVRSLAGVLVPFSERDGQMTLLLTRRAAHMRNHAREMSFPGGRLDPEDPDLRHAALREAHEEVDLAASDVHLYGALASVPTLSGFEIHAFAGEFDAGHTLRPNPGEIERLHHVPLTTLVAPGVHTFEVGIVDGFEFTMHYYDCVGDPPIWGATAYIIYELLTALGVEH